MKLLNKLVILKVKKENDGKNVAIVKSKQKHTFFESFRIKHCSNYTLLKGKWKLKKSSDFVRRFFNNHGLYKVTV